MIINRERDPKLSLYYLGAQVISILKETNGISIDDLISRLDKLTETELHVNFVYYTIDWLYILSLVRVEEGLIHYGT